MTLKIGNPEQSQTLPGVWIQSIFRVDGLYQVLHTIYCCDVWVSVFKPSCRQHVTISIMWPGRHSLEPPTFASYSL